MLAEGRCLTVPAFIFLLLMLFDANRIVTLEHLKQTRFFFEIKLSPQKPFSSRLVEKERKENSGRKERVGCHVRFFRNRGVLYVRDAGDAGSNGKAKREGRRERGRGGERAGECRGIGGRKGEGGLLKG